MAASVLEEIKRKIEKKYKESTELFPDFSTIKEIEVIPSPSATINAITGVGGFPRGRLSEIHGPYSSGKTTLAIEICAEAQRRLKDPVVLFLDYEQAFDAGYARKLGLDLASDKFIFVQPEYFEQGALIIDSMVDLDLVDIIVIDSAAAMTPRAELEGEWDKDGGSQKGLQANLMARFLSSITKKLNRGRKPAMVLINQTRAVIDIGGRPRKNAPKEQAAGGNAIKFYTSMRILLEIVTGEGDAARGTKGTDQLYTQNRVRVTCIKNKVAPPWMRGTIIIEYGKGINNVASVGDLAEARLGIMSGAGFYDYTGEKPETTFKCRGREAFQKILEESPEILQEIEAKVLSNIKAEHAKLLGIDDIKISGKAKNIEDDNFKKKPLILGTESNINDPEIEDA